MYNISRGNTVYTSGYSINVYLTAHVVTSPAIGDITEILLFADHSMKCAERIV